MAQLETLTASSSAEILEGFDAVVGYNKGSIISLDGESHSIGWQNGSADDITTDSATPINADNLNRMHFAICAIRDAIVNSEDAYNGQFAFNINGETVVFDQDHPLYDIIHDLAFNIVGGVNSSDVTQSKTTLHGLRNYLLGLDYDKANTTLSFLTSIKQVDGKIVETEIKELGVNGINDDSNLNILEDASGDTRRVIISNEREVYARRNLADSLIVEGDTYTENLTKKPDSTNSKITVNRAKNVTSIDDTNSASTDTISFSIGDKSFSHKITRVGESALSDDTKIESLQEKYVTQTVGGVKGSIASPIRIADDSVNGLLSTMLGIQDSVPPSGFKIESSLIRVTSYRQAGSGAVTYSIPIKLSVNTGTTAGVVFDYYIDESEDFSSPTRYSGGSTQEITYYITEDKVPDNDVITIHAKVECMWEEQLIELADSIEIPVARKVVWLISPTPIEWDSVSLDDGDYITLQELVDGYTVEARMLDDGGAYMGIAYPAKWESLTSITDSNGMECLNAFSEDTVVKSNGDVLRGFRTIRKTGNSMNLTFAIKDELPVTLTNTTGAVSIAAPFSIRTSSPIDIRFVIEDETQWREVFSYGAYPSMMFALTNQINIDGEIYLPGFYRVAMDGTPHFIEEPDRKITVDEVDALFSGGEE